MSNVVDKVLGAVSGSFDFFIDKNRRTAQLNRISAIIKSESDELDNAYIALGKIYLNTLNGSAANEAEVAQLLEKIEKCKARLKKARARYAYISTYGVPKKGVNPQDIEAAMETCEDNKDAECKDADEEEQDITIAYADPTAAIENDAIDADPTKFDGSTEIEDNSEE